MTSKCLGVKVLLLPANLEASVTQVLYVVQLNLWGRARLWDLKGGKS